MAARIDQVRCQEIFDYSTYDQPDSVRYLVGMGEPMDYEPPMVAPTVPTMVWGGQVRLIARALGVELDEIRETLERRPLESTVTNAMGDFAEGTQGALRFEVQGIVDGEPLIVVEHVTRIAPVVRSRLADAPRRGRRRPPGDDRGPPPHRGQRRGHRRRWQSGRRRQRHRGGPAGERHPVAARLPPPGIHDALDVPLAPAPGRLGRSAAMIIEPAGIDVPDDEHPIMYVWGSMVPGIGAAAAAFSQSVYERHHSGPPGVRGGTPAYRPDQRMRVLPGLAHRTGRRDRGVHLRRSGRGMADHRGVR